MRPLAALLFTLILAAPPGLAGPAARPPEVGIAVQASSLGEILPCT